MTLKEYKNQSQVKPEDKSQISYSQIDNQNLESSRNNEESKSMDQSMIGQKEEYIENVQIELKEDI